MRFYFYTTPVWLKKLYRSLDWTIQDAKSNQIYLTFDDGPVPGATTTVLDILRSHNAKATFFVVGENVRKHPQLLRDVGSEGHQIGNHTFNHVKGWGNSVSDYISQVDACDQIIEATLGKASGLFRPPYGRITFAQARAVSQSHKVIMWQILSGDFDPGLNVKTSLQALRRAKGGDILVFHDSQK